MERWWRLIQKWFFNRWNPEEHLFDDLDLKRFLEKTLTIYTEKTAAKQVTWIEVSEVRRIAHLEVTGEYDKAPNLDMGLLVMSTGNISLTEITVHLKDFDYSAGFAQIQPGRVYAPVCHPKTHQVLGVFILGGVPMGQEKSVAKDLSLFNHRIAKHLWFCLEYNKARGESFMDDLTGLHNQKFMSLALDTEIHRSARNNVKFSVLFMDIDYFKAVNDTKGHWVGSRLLVELARILKSHTRRSDYCFRYGGDEFVVVLPDTDQAGAMIAAERLRKRVEGTDFLIDGLQLNLTLSIGIATYPDHAQSHKEIIQMADQAMYSGKHKSRNIVFMAG